MTDGGEVVGRRVRRFLARPTVRDVRVRVAGPDGRPTVAVTPFVHYVAAAVTGEAHEDDSERSAPDFLAALAVCARTYVLDVLLRAGRSEYDVGAGVSDLITSRSIGERTRGAVSTTSGWFLARPGLHRSRGLVRLHLHAACGGHTEAASTVWPAAARVLGCVGVPCWPCRSSPPTWRASSTARDVAESLRLAPTDGSSAGAVRIVAGRRSATGRMLRCTVACNGGRIDLSGEQLRHGLGLRRVPSTWFDVDHRDDQIVFEGRGYGHGVGLCKFGARTMASAGVSWKDILAYYFPRARLVHRRRVP